MRVAIHQPNFMPWIGLFHKAAMADRFVMFDHVQAPRGRSWLTRNRILVQGAPRWLTIPTQGSGNGLEMVNEVRIQWDDRLVSKQLRTLAQEYGRHPHFDDVFELVTQIYARRPALVADLNKSFLTGVLARLGLEVELVSSAKLSLGEPTLLELAGSELVLATCRAAGGSEYICGAGSGEYIHPSAFEEAGVAFWEQSYVHPEYEQRGTREFVSHLSVLDALFNVGFERVRELVVHEARTRVRAG